MPEPTTPSSEHRWSGWPGAWCLDCGTEDRSEICATSHQHAQLDPERNICIIPCQTPPCFEPGSNRNNPYDPARRSR